MTNKKLYHSIMDLDYWDGISTIPNQTNRLINKIIHNFYDNYHKDFLKKTFILEYQDDIYGVIAYKLLSIMKELFNFKFKIFGKVKYTKKIYQNKINFISKRKLNKIPLEDKIYISCFNPIHKVYFKEKKFNSFLKQNVYYILKDFTPIEILTAMDFYKIPYYEKVKRNKDKDIIYHLIELNDLYCKNINNIPINITLNISNNKFNLVFLSGSEKDFEIFDKVKDSDCLNFYFIKDEKFLKNQPLGFYCKHKFNTPLKEYGNINNKDIPRRLSIMGFKYESFGNYVDKDFWNI